MAGNGSDTNIATGEDFGAIRITDLDKLYKAQRSAVVDIVKSVHKVASTSAVEHRVGARSNERTTLSNRQRHEYDRPHHSYVIDGVRGSGKTTVLLTIRNLLENLGFDSSVPIREGLGDDLRHSLLSLSLVPPKEAQVRDPFALVLPVVFTEDMETKESAMDAILALLQFHIDDRLQLSPNSDSGKRLSALKKELREDVTLPWAYSRQVGFEILSQDVIDYRDYLGRWADYNVKSYNKISLWHNFVEKALDALGREILVVSFDDSDLDQHAAEDIIRAMRIYLSHPRIVSILAVDMKTLDVALRAQHLSQNVGVIKLGEVGLADDVVSLAKSNTRALLDKVIPVALRRRLNIDDLSFLDIFFSGSISDPFGAWCRERFEWAESESGTTPAQRPPIALLKAVWWLLAGPYRRIVADNIRHVVLFRELTRSKGSSPLPPLMDYFRLRDLMGRVDDNLETLRAYVEVAAIPGNWPVGTEVSESTTNDYEDRFIDMWVDANIVYRKLRVWNSALVIGWLPDPIGDGREPAIQDPGKRLGVAGLAATRLPRNCLYVYQYRRLCSLVVRTLPEGSRWLDDLDGWGALDLPRAAADLIDELQHESDAEVLRNIEIRLDSVRGAATGSRDPFRRSRLATSLVAIIAAARPGSGDRGAFFETLSRIKANEDREDNDAFIRRLAAAVRRAELRRQEALFTWACALEIADMGDDNRQQRSFGPRKQLAVTIGATSRDIEPRFLILVNKTLEHLALGGRHALLLQWSLIPLIACLHEYGTDYRRAVEGPSPAWEEISRIKIAATPIGSVEGPDTSWTFADMAEDTLAEIRQDISKLIASFKTTLSTETAPGSIRFEEVWPATPARFLAALLITSEQWVKDEKLVAQGL